MPEVSRKTARAIATWALCGGVKTADDISRLLNRLLGSFLSRNLARESNETAWAAKSCRVEERLTNVPNLFFRETQLSVYVNLALCDSS
jgi:hypothetical protein